MVSAPFATNNTVTKGTKLPKSRTVIRKLSFAPRSRAALSLPIAAQFLRCQGRSLWLQRCDFRTVKESFPLTTAAQNIHVFLQKSPLCRSHFFEWLKTAISSNACGTSTLKSPLLRAFFTPHVHPRLRKRPPRCTLDCGFKTPESPALRGFVGGLRALATAALYLVIFSNGLRHSKNLPEKFGFSPIDTPANIVRKLPLQRCFKALFIPFFNFSHKWPTFAFVGESGYTSLLLRGSHTREHTAKQGAFQMGVVSLPSERSTRFGNPAWPGIRTANFAALGSWPGGALEGHRKPSEQRCAYARRCSEASRPRWAA